MNKSEFVHNEGLGFFPGMIPVGVVLTADKTAEKIIEEEQQKEQWAEMMKTLKWVGIGTAAFITFGVTLAVVND